MQDLKNKKLVTVIMSVYNAEDFLSEAIESILNQTFFDFEFIITDDRGTDSSAKIIKEYADRDNRIKVITNPENWGLTKSLNKMISLAHGKYIVRMDADDIAEPERIQDQVAYMDSYPQIALLGSNYIEINADGKRLGIKKMPTANKCIQSELIKYNTFFHGAVIIRRSALDKVGVYNENFKKAQDYDLWFRIAEHFQIANLDKPLMRRRYTPGMISIEKENEQIKWAIRARYNAIKRRQYHFWAFVYFIRPFLVLITPKLLRKFIRQKFLGNKMYD